MGHSEFQGVITPLLTPYEDDHAIATDLYLDHAARCLGDGSHYISPFGTTGEALSNSSAERMKLLDLLVSSGTAQPGQIMPGTGLCALEDTLTLTRHAVGLGCAAVMVLPPFFYVNAGDEGLYRYFSQLIERLGAFDPKICLYHIPQMAGIGISPELAKRLNDAFPQNVVAYKDSSGDWNNTKAVIEAAPGLSVFPASETSLVSGLKAGGAGCISATCNTNIAEIRRLFEFASSGNSQGAAAMEPAIRQHRVAVQEAGLIPALKSMVAAASGDRRWLNLRPPLENADEAVGQRLCRALSPGI